MEEKIAWFEEGGRMDIRSSMKKYFFFAFFLNKNPCYSFIMMQISLKLFYAYVNIHNSSAPYASPA